MPKHGSINLYVHGSQKSRWDGQPRTATSTLTQLLNYECLDTVVVADVALDPIETLWGPQVHAAEY